MLRNAVYLLSFEELKSVLFANLIAKQQQQLKANLKFLVILYFLLK